ncbi:hypothetical protein D3C76_1453730 [compost metagenome]
MIRPSPFLMGWAQAARSPLSTALSRTAAQLGSVATSCAITLSPRSTAATAEPFPSAIGMRPVGIRHSSGKSGAAQLTSSVPSSATRNTAPSTPG